MLFDIGPCINSMFKIPSFIVIWMRRFMYCLFLAFIIRKQISCWFSKFSTTIKQVESQQSKADYSLFIKIRGASFTIILLYVSDMIITGNNNVIIKELKRFLHNIFRIKNLSHLKYFLGVVVAYSKQDIAISQCKYTLDIL